MSSVWNESVFGGTTAGGLNHTDGSRYNHTVNTHKMFHDLNSWSFLLKTFYWVSDLTQVIFEVNICGCVKVKSIQNWCYEKKSCEFLTLRTKCFRPDWISVKFNQNKTHHTNVENEAW